MSYESCDAEKYCRAGGAATIAPGAAALAREHAK